MPSRNILLFTLLFVLLSILFLADLAWGSIQIPVSEILAVFGGDRTNLIYSEIILNFRLPKAVTALLTGASLSVAGLMMQTLFRNPLAEPYILGVSSGASLGVALVMMASTILPIAFISSSWSLATAAIIGAGLVLFLVILVSFRIQSTVSLLIIGIMFGTIAGSIVSVLQNISNPDAIKLFIIWTFGSLSAVTWESMQVLFPVVFIGLTTAFLMHKKLDVFLLGENYARGLGISIQKTRLMIVIVTGLLAGGITAFTGPIAFIGIAVPHLTRGIFKTSSHKILIPGSMLMGGALLLICDIISQLPKHTLPINTISALFGAPVIIWIILRRR